MVATCVTHSHTCSDVSLPMNPSFLDSDGFQAPRVKSFWFGTSLLRAAASALPPGLGHGVFDGDGPCEDM